MLGLGLGLWLGNQRAGGGGPTPPDPDPNDSIITEDGLSLFVTEDSQSYIAQE